MNTHDRYTEAVRACRSVGLLDQSLGEIARMYGLTDQALRLYLKRHHPKVLEERNRLRTVLRQDDLARRKLTKKAMARYAHAVGLLQNSLLSIAEVAEDCHLDADDLMQHVLLLNRKLVSSRPKSSERADNLRRKERQYKALYAEALELYRTTDRTEADIAQACGVRYDRFHTFLNRWCRDDIAERINRRHEKEKKPIRRDDVA